MILDKINIYRLKNSNIQKNKVFNSSSNEGENDINIYPNLRYDNFNKNNNSILNNENNKYNNKNEYPNYFSKIDKFRIEKDRYQKFNLNNSSSCKNYKNKFLIPMISDLKRNNSKIYLNQINSNINGDEINNKTKRENNYQNNNLILSPNDIYNNSSYKDMNIFNKFILFPKHYIYDKFNGKRRTDITNSELAEKCLPGSNQDYIDYINKNREVDLFNKRLLDNKHKIRVSERNKMILKERNLINEENNYFKKACLRDILYNNNKKKFYRKVLDNQVGHIIENKLVNENLSYSQFLKNKDYNRLKTPIMKYLDQNDYFDVNPYNNKSINLGQSGLKYNTILNPRVQYKTNKYLFPEIANNNIEKLQKIVQ